MKIFKNKHLYGCFSEFLVYVIFFLFIKFIVIILVNKIIQILGAQFYNISSVHCIVCPPPEVTVHHHFSPHTLLHLLLFPPSPQQSLHCCLCPQICLFFSFFSQSFYLSNKSLNPTALHRLLSMSLFCLLVYFVH